MNASVVAAFKTLAAGFTDCPLYWPNDRVVPPDPPSAFVWAERFGLKSEVVSMGDAGAHTIRDDGFIRFHVMAPYGEGETNMLTICDDLAALFRITTPGGLVGLQTLAPSAPEGGAQSDDGNWYGFSFSVGYFYYYQG